MLTGIGNHPQGRPFGIVDLQTLEVQVTEDQYIRLVIAKHRTRLPSLRRARLIAAQLCPDIRRWAGIHLVAIQPTGSYAKGTNITGSTDLDLFVSLRATTPLSIDKIYRSLARYLKKRGYSIREQNVSIGVEYKNVSIDLVPARRQPRSIYDHTIWRRKAKKWAKTNVHKHVLLVKASGRLDEIRAVKIWRKLRGLDFPSFYLELCVIKALVGYGRHRLAPNVCRVFEYLADEFEEATILDPSNSNNVVSEELTSAEKEEIATAAYQSQIEPYWADCIW